ncbi:MAG: sigma-70 family RNA polymerase sigma factor [Myxococcota bacterium]
MYGPWLVAEKGASQPEEEAAFVARLRARDETAFNELMQLYQKRVFAVVYRMLGRRSEAEEVTQEVFTQVFRYIDNFRGESKLSTWLFRIAVNLSKNRRRSNQRRGSGKHQDVDAMADYAPLGAAEGVSVGSVARPDEMVAGLELEGIVRVAIQRIDADFRELVILRDVEELSYEEIAEVTGLNRGTVKSRIHRGRVQLRQHVEAMLGEALGGRAQGRGSTGERVRGKKKKVDS